MPIKKSPFKAFVKISYLTWWKICKWLSRIAEADLEPKTSSDVENMVEEDRKTVVD
jgi:hypothetical protein